MASGWRLTWREIRAIAAVEALDGFRSRRQLLIRAVTPIVLFFCVLGITLALRGTQTATHPQPYRIAVQGDFAGAQRTLAKLREHRPDRLEFVADDHAKVATITSADAGMLVPDGLDRILDERRDEPVTVEVYEVTVNQASRAAAVLVRSGFVDLHQREVQDRLRQERQGRQVDNIFTVDVTNVERTAEGTRTLSSQVIPGLVCLQAAMLIAGTSNRLVSRRTRGLVTAQLVLPVSRRALAFAKGLGELSVGTVTAIPVVLAVLAFGALTGGTGGVVGTVGNLVATAVTMLVLFAFTTALGVVIGTAARTPEQVSLATGGALIVATLVATTVALATVQRPAWVNALPVAGSVNALREQLNGTGSALAFAVAAAVTLIAGLGLITLAGRSLDAERMVMRNG